MSGDGRGDGGHWEEVVAGRLGRFFHKVLLSSELQVLRQDICRPFLPAFILPLLSENFKNPGRVSRESLVSLWLRCLLPGTVQRGFKAPGEKPQGRSSQVEAVPGPAYNLDSQSGSSVPEL